MISSAEFVLNLLHAWCVFGLIPIQAPSEDDTDQEGKAVPTWMRALKKTREANKAAAEAKEKEKEAAKADPKLARLQLRKTSAPDKDKASSESSDTEALDFRSLLRPRGGDTDDDAGNDMPPPPAPPAGNKGGESPVKLRSTNLKRNSQVIQEEDEEATSKGSSRRSTLKRSSIISTGSGAGDVPVIPEPDYAGRSDQLKDELDKEAGTLSRKGSKRSLKRQSIAEDSAPEEDKEDKSVPPEAGEPPKHPTVAALQRASMDLRPQSPMEEIQQQVSLETFVLCFV